MKNCRNVRFVSSFVKKKKKNEGESSAEYVLSCFASLFSEAFSLSSNSLVQFVPFLSTRECTVPGGVCFGSCQTQLSVFICPFIPPFIVHTPSQALQNLGCSSFNQIFFFFFFVISLSGLEMFKSASLGEIFFGSYVKVLSVASWNYLGAKLIALDPTLHCNRLSANLGFSRCSQVSPRQWLHQAVCSSQGFDLCHTLLSPPLSHTNFLLSVAVMFVRTLFGFACLSFQSYRTSAKLCAAPT